MNLTVRNIPENVISVIKTMATKEKRSLNSEILVLLENATKSNTNIVNNADIWENIGNAWDDVDADELIKDIYENRTVGRYDIEL
jgi:plasmid stability protein